PSSRGREGSNSESHEASHTIALSRNSLARVLPRDPLDRGVRAEAIAYSGGSRPPLRGWQAPAGALGGDPRSGSQETRPWREQDSNHRSPRRESALQETASRGVVHSNVIF